MYNVIGLMSGSSLDGIDLVDANFWHDGGWHFEIVTKDNFEYDHAWKKRLSDAFYMSPDELKNLDIQYGKLLGKVTKSFIDKFGLKPEIVASHGHTIFHRPQERYTLQIGDGQSIADICGVKVINDFRTEDVLKGGQGAPLVPVGDKFLFAEFQICLNIGGIANVSYDVGSQRIAYDICIANQALNFLANLKNMDYDRDGYLARNGIVDNQLLEKLNSHPYHSRTFPKSLGREFFEDNVKPLFKQESNPCPLENLMATFVEHIAIQVGKSVENQPFGKMLITGGGAKNKFLTERIQANTKHEVIIPDNDIIDYKEALVFAFLGLLRNRNEINVFKSVTGAESDSCSGKIFLP
ncbi:MAG: anhydro-N-acetylmuramic acid kinase [Bacteroidales bacterium]|nr:anhydro-N-acetylmuramic acid kinase [Bacteroidales bacterium]